MGDFFRGGLRLLYYMLAVGFLLVNKGFSSSLRLLVNQKKDCKNALEYYNQCKSVGGQPITEDFTKALAEQCKTK